METDVLDWMAVATALVFVLALTLKVVFRANSITWPVNAVLIVVVLWAGVHWRLPPLYWLGFLAAACQVLMTGAGLLALREARRTGYFVRRSGKRVTGADFEFGWKIELVLTCVTLIIVIAAVVWSGTCLLSARPAVSNSLPADQPHDVGGGPRR
jgi:hypothetical protein